MSSKPLQIGITGGIGSGKSIVCKLFNCLGIPVYEADVRAKWLTNHNPAIKQKVVELLGPESYTGEGLYSTGYVAGRVFGNEQLLKSLNGIIHPAVQEDTLKWVEANAHAPYTVKEAAIMNKAGAGNTLDFVIVVEAPEDVRIQRILKRDRRTEDEIRAIIRRQISDDARNEIADFKISNDGNTPLIPQVMHLHKHFLELAAR